MFDFFKKKTTEPKEHKQSFYDSWTNKLTGAGTEKDKKSHIEKRVYNFSQTEIDKLYKDSFLKNLVEIYPFFMTKNFIELDEKDVNYEFVESEFKRLNIKQKLFQCLVLNDLYGGCIAFLGIDDGQTLDMPLNINNIKKFNYINILSKYDLSTYFTNLDPTTEDYGKTEYITLSNGAIIHKSRILEFNRGNINNTNNRLDYFGHSLFNEIYGYFLYYISPILNSSQLFEDARLDIYKMKDLDEVLSADGNDLFMNKMTISNVMKNVFGAMMMDTEEEYSRINTNFANMDNLINEFKILLCSAVKIPKTILFGEQSKGLNSNNNGDLEIFYGNVNSRQEFELTKHIDYLILLLNANKSIKWEFNPLWDMSDLEKANIKKIKAESCKTKQESCKIRLENYQTKTTLGLPVEEDKREFTEPEDD